MARALAACDVEPKAISYSRARPGGDLSPEISEVRAARDELEADRVALVGRSFGGRVCTRLAALETPAALVVLGHPISPRNRPRPDDEAALAAVRCRTLIVQGDHDPLGPLEVLERIARSNKGVEIYVLKDTGHNFGKRQAEGVTYAADWVSKVLRG
jgi:uncharacterized protein